MLTGRPFQGVLVDTKATKVDAPLDLNALEVCTVSGVPLIYPTVLTISGGVVCANDPTAINTANDRTAMRRNTQRLEIAVFGFQCFNRPPNRGESIVNRRCICTKCSRENVAVGSSPIIFLDAPQAKREMPI